MFFRFIFRNAQTGETLSAIAPHIDAGARALAIAEPWGPWECWTASGACLWHYQAGERFEGPRPVGLIEAAQALLDWAREHTSPRQKNSPHELLIALARALEEARK